MRSLRKVRSLRVTALVLLGTAQLTGCTAWKTENVAPVQELKTPIPASLRVTLTGGATRHLDSARIENDSLVGNVAATKGGWRHHAGESVYIPGQPAGRTAFALAEVARTQARRSDAARTVALAVPLTAAAGFLALVAIFSGYGD